MLPSKKFIEVVGVLAIALGGMLLFIKLPSTSTIPTQATDTNTSGAQDTSVTFVKGVDTGLGQGTQAEPTSAQGAQAGTLSYIQKGNLTQGVSQKLLSDYSAIAQQNGTVTPEQTKEIAGSLAASLHAEASIPQYTIHSFVRIKATTAEIHTYGNFFMVQTVVKHQDLLARDEVPLFTQMIQSGDIAPKKTLLARSAAYKQIAEDLRLIYVPDAIADQHVTIANSYIHTSQAIDNMAIGLDDIARGVIGMDQYIKASRERAAAMEKIKQYFTDNHVTFSDKEVGFIWTKI